MAFFMHDMHICRICRRSVDRLGVWGYNGGNEKVELTEVYRRKKKRLMQVRKKFGFRGYCQRGETEYGGIFYD